MVFLNDQHLKAYMKATEQRTETLEERLNALIATTDAISEKLEEIIAFLETTKKWFTITFAKTPNARMSFPSELMRQEFGNPNARNATTRLTLTRQ